MKTELQADIKDAQYFNNVFIYTSLHLILDLFFSQAVLVLEFTLFQPLAVFCGTEFKLEKEQAAVEQCLSLKSVT